MTSKTIFNLKHHKRIQVMVICLKPGLMKKFKNLNHLPEKLAPIKLLRIGRSDRVDLNEVAVVFMKMARRTYSTIRQLVIFMIKKVEIIMSIYRNRFGHNKITNYKIIKQNN